MLSWTLVWTQTLLLRPSYCPPDLSHRQVSMTDTSNSTYEEEEEAFLLFANHLHSFLRYCVALHTLCICDPTLRCQ